MRSFFRRLAACAALFCANPRAFLRGLADPDSPVRRLLRRRNRLWLHVAKNVSR